MKNKGDSNFIKIYWKKHDIEIVFSILLVIFFCYTLFLALNLDWNITPDEPTQFVNSKQFSTTLGIPADTFDTYNFGGIIKQWPYMFYWINGRIINLINFITPSISDWQLLITLRVINIFYSLGTLIFCYLFSKELIHNKWWQLLPVFLLTNTINFVFVAGGLSYDNLLNLFAMAGLYFLVRVLKHKNFLLNSLAWMIFISAGTLTKRAGLPLALAMGVVWIVFLIKNHKQIFPLKFDYKKILLSLVLLLLIIGNLGLYGYNLIVYKSILPGCTDILTKEQCNLTQYVRRLENYALDEKLTIDESKELGYPGPIKYLFTQWILNFFSRIYGPHGNSVAYVSIPVTIAHIILFFWLVALAIVDWRDFNFTIVSLLAIFIFYTLILFNESYNSELIFGFKGMRIQGRYIIPVIGIAYTFFSKVLMNVPKKLIRLPILIILLLLYFYSGPLTFILKYSSEFSEWFVK
jgi:hypothetical protein